MAHGGNNGQAPQAIFLSNNTMMRYTEPTSEDKKLLNRIDIIQNLRFKSTNQQMSHIYLGYFYLSDTALKKTFLKISCSVDRSQKGLQEVMRSRL
jgi:hypothetical protein